MEKARTLGAEKVPGLKSYLSPVGAWALSIGCAVGWGAFAMPGTQFLPAAGPLGTTIGFIIGSLIMLVIAANYHYMMKCYSFAGGTYTYSKKMFNSDHGFFSAWFMILAYITILWANLSALPLIGRNIFGGALKIGYMYSIADYDIYFGEVAFELIILVFTGAVCMYSKKLSGIVQTLFAMLLVAGVVVCFCVGLSGGNAGAEAKSVPMFSDSEGIPSQIAGIIALTPWAFIGFESVSHSAQEFKFTVRRSFVVMAAGIAASCFCYVLLTWTAITSLPEGCSDWTQYIAALGSYEGHQSMPVVNAMYTAAGNNGLLLLMITLLAAVLTGMVGSSIAAGRLIYSMSEDDILPKNLGKLSKKGNTPKNAIMLITLISCVIPFLGRTATGWVVDIMSFAATIAYGYTSVCAVRKARQDGNKLIVITGYIGTAVSVILGVFIMLPNVFTTSVMSDESYLLLAIWSIIGILFFRFVFSKDNLQRFGKSISVWIALLFVIFVTTLMWMRQTTNSVTEKAVDNIGNYYAEEMTEHGVDRDSVHAETERGYVNGQMEEIRGSLLTNTVIQMGLIMLSLIVIFNIYSTMQKREKAMEAQKNKAEESSRAKSAFLSNMSHDLRTPMNAIIGYIELARNEDLTADELREYLAKIGGSSRHLLALINDVLEMSRIESGKTELELIDAGLPCLMDDMRDLFATQMSEKKIKYTVTCEGLKNKVVKCDKNRINRVLLNLISNAYKFTPEGGSVTVKLSQTEGEAGDDTGIYELRVKDSGMGMSPEFAKNVFEAFERERTSTASGIEGTGLGMAITKSIIDLMGGTITVDTAPGKGTEFIVTLTLARGDKCNVTCRKNCSEKANEPESAGNDVSTEKAGLSGRRMLVVDDIMVNREITMRILKMKGFEAEPAENGQQALDIISASEPGHYDAVFMDIQMPVMDGYEATRRIRELSDPQLRDIPIIAMTANAFSEDVQKAKEAGMNGHVSKPIDVNAMLSTLTGILQSRESSGQQT